MKMTSTEVLAFSITAYKATPTHEDVFLIQHSMHNKQQTDPVQLTNVSFHALQTVRTFTARTTFLYIHRYCISPCDDEAQGHGARQFTGQWGV